MGTCLLGDVSIARPQSGALGVLLRGKDTLGRPTELALGGTRLESLAQHLDGVRVELHDGRVRIVTAAGDAFDIAASSAHLHRDLSVELAAVIAPRAAGRSRRLLLYGMLWLARSAAGRGLLVRIRAGARR